MPRRNSTDQVIAENAMTIAYLDQMLDQRGGFAKRIRENFKVAL